MDVTHIPAFGKLSFVHVTVDTFSHVIIASARSGEATRDVIQHLFQCFSQIGLPKQIKTDKAPAYTSAAFKRFCQGEEPRWRRSRTGRTLSPPQIHQKSS